MKLKISTIVIITILSISIILAGCSTTEKVKQAPAVIETFAQCLTANGATFYGTEWCPHCKAQKEVFQNAMQYVNYVDCDANKTTCQKAGITGYPTWIFKDGSKLEGTQSISKLAAASGCALT